MSGYNPRQNWLPGPGFTPLTERLSVPNNLLSTLQEAAYNSDFSPIPSRGQNSIVYSSIGNSMAEKRRERFLKAKKPSVTEKSKVNPEDIHAPGKNDDSMSYSKLGEKELAQPPKKEKEEPQKNGAIMRPQEKREPQKNGIIMRPQEKVEPQKNGVVMRPPLEVQRKMSIVDLSTYNQLNSKKCCCARPKRTVWCRMCGYHIKGNVKMICPVHNQRHNLYEIDVCGNPRCRAPRHLIEIDL